MAKELNATCQICGKKYHMCRTCSSNRGTWESWMQHTDTEDCFKIFTILYDRRIEAITDAEAKEKLQKCNLTGLNTFKENIKNTINEVLGNSVVKTVDAKKVEAVETVEEVNEVESVEDKAEQPEESKKTKKKFSL